MNTSTQALLNSLGDRIAAEADLAGYDLLPLVRPSVRLTTERTAESDLALGESRIGGLPDVPPGFEWPRWEPDQRRPNKFPWPRTAGPTPLGFISQLDMSQIPAIDLNLPQSGWLFFFYDRIDEPWGYDPYDRGGCRVVYTDCDRCALIRAVAPADAQPEHVASACRVTAEAELTLPSEIAEIEFDTPPYWAYERVREALNQLEPSIQHRLLGHPQVVQNPMERECQLASNGIDCGGAVRMSNMDLAKIASLEAGIADWRLLLQIDTDEAGPGWGWGDGGRIYFWIKQQDLTALRFDDIWLVLQCS